MANAHHIHLQHSSDSSTNTAPTAPSTSVSGVERIVRRSGDDFELHVKQLVEGFEALIQEIQLFRSQVPLVRLPLFEQSERVTKAGTSVGHIRQSMGFGLPVVKEDKQRMPIDTEHIEAPNNSFSKPRTETEQIEINFTTKGKESSLGCPFASMDGPMPLDHHPQRVPATAHRLRSLSVLDARKYQGRATTDPITAELYGIPLASPPPSVAGSASRCPIRFLDQHSPEEVAQYFESHKHELPRSHEICVKRYQSNEESIRQLDAKYGNLVSMIQGLGIKHKPLLPANDDESDDMAETRPNWRVEMWAEGVSGTHEHGDGEAAEEERSDRGRSQDRGDNADRPMKEVRVGESPSRLWGIPIPPMQESKPAMSTTEHAEAARSSIMNPSASAKKKACPMRHLHTISPQQEQPQQQNPNPEPKTTSSNVQFRHNAAFIPQSAMLAGAQGSLSQQAPQMVFTGPVFIGYPIEQAMALIQQLSRGVGVNAPSS